MSFENATIHYGAFTHLEASPPSEQKIKRRDAEIGEGEIINLQQGKKEVKEVAEGLEFGAMTENKIEIAKDDEIVIVGK